MTIQLVDDAVEAGARRESACEVLGLSARTLERWRGKHPEDMRHGPKTTPANKLTARERASVLKVINEPAYRDRSPNEIVPLLADEKRYVASESTMYRIMREERLLHHRGRSKAPVRRPPNAHVATAPNQVWSWDITYLKSPIRGVFFYLYMIVDVWSRKVVGWEVHDVESAEHAAALFERTCAKMNIDPRGIVLHSDNGGPMKGSTMTATLQRLGVVPSFSRPHVSDDNPYSEALFRTLKYSPSYPTQPFVDVPAARRWVEHFVTWYNSAHLHSGIRFVTPDARHSGKDAAILARRAKVYAAARAKNPARWTRSTRNWSPINVVYLNPDEPKRSDAPALGCVVERGDKGGALADRGSPPPIISHSSATPRASKSSAPRAATNAQARPDYAQARPERPAMA